MLIAARFSCLLINSTSVVALPVQIAHNILIIIYPAAGLRFCRELQQRMEKVSKFRVQRGYCSQLNANRICLSLCMSLESLYGQRFCSVLLLFTHCTISLSSNTKAQ